jgi:methionyl-tRNA formyltransferase
MRIVFLGTPEFAVPTLEALAAGGHDIAAVYTQPDRPKGRGNQLTAAPVKEAAMRLGLKIFQPERVRRPENVAALEALRPDIMVVVGYGQIIPQSIINIPTHGILNVHASLLPKYRGAAPIQWAIANGESETGVTIMRIDAGLDTGDMLLRAATDIGARDTAPELSLRLSQQGAELLIDALRRIEAGSATYERQNEGEATLAPILTKEDGRVAWSRTACEIDNRLRGFTPWPGAFSSFRGQLFQLLRASADPQSSVLPPGTIIKDKRRLLVACGGESTLELQEIQLQGKKRVPAEAFLNGYTFLPGEQFGEAH